MKWAVLVGGTGSNLRALLQTGFPVSLVVSHRPGVGALAIAQAHHIPHAVITPKPFGKDREAYDAALREVLHQHQIEAVALAGFLRWLTATTVDHFRGRIVNIHPSLLPAFAGLHAIERAYAAGVLWTGVTVHFVDEGQDTGPVIAQTPVPRYPDDSLEALEARIHQAEHELYPKVLWALDGHDIAWRDGHVYWSEEARTWIHGH
jgi:phosphoribosylglycinamide formyltransferase-1